MQVGRSDLQLFWHCDGISLALLGYVGSAAGKPYTIPEENTGLCPNPENWVTHFTKSCELSHTKIGNLTNAVWFHRKKVIEYEYPD